MADSLNMSLDDIIKKNKQQQKGRHGGRNKGHTSDGDEKRRHVRVCRTRMTPYSMSQERDLMKMAGGGDHVHGTKLFVSNLDYGVTNDDIRLLFSDVGELKEYALHYDNSGRSKGTAEVVFTYASGALAAIKRYNNIQLDGRPMKIEVVGVNAPTHPVPIFASANLQASFQRPGGAAYGRARVERSHHKPVSATVSKKKKPVSAEDLDADLDKYHSDAMHIN
ncbi:THO complex subunit 4A-like [Lycium barbarum]|uniref:THO complex subunit 4A-like n=1 Tax=Lycium barbarum TaxID=112863 RepID=UPI00293EB066|nr:THO complex subunit 4A-like [Lycium barbarum]